MVQFSERRTCYESRIRNTASMLNRHNGVWSTSRTDESGVVGVVNYLVLLKGLSLDYLSRSEQLSYGKHTPHRLTESLGWHNRYLRNGNMRAAGSEL